MYLGIINSSWKQDNNRLLLPKTIRHHINHKAHFIYCIAYYNIKQTIKCILSQLEHPRTKKCR